jgi:catechol 2,3-dioxygenase-like lactoylglutathione lyase family enzyme
MAKNTEAGLFKERENPETLRLRTVLPSFTVRDLGKSIAFYRDALGFLEDERWEENGVLVGIMLRAGTCQLGLSQDDFAKGRDRAKGGGVRISLETLQDIDAVAARAKGAGAQLTEEPGDRAWGVRSFSIDDPDGYHLTIYRNLA